MKNSLDKRLCKIKMLGFDFDGIFTDGKVFFRQDGIETVVCSRKDSLGTNMLQANNIYLCVISKEANSVVAERCKKMGIDYVQAVKTGKGKKEVLQQIAKEKGFSASEVSFMGDDVNDLKALGWAGVAFTVADGHPKVKKVADYITQKNGGDHAVREVCELILKKRGFDLNT